LPHVWTRVDLEQKFLHCRSQVMPKRQRHRRSLSPARLKAMIEEATVDAYGESEQIAGFFTMLDERFKLPFHTEVLEMDVRVERIDMTDDGQIVAMCLRGKSRQPVPILDLTLPDPPPEGAEWIEAYRRWARGR
jgi:hypothetical protein